MLLEGAESGWLAAALLLAATVAYYFVRSEQQQQHQQQCGCKGLRCIEVIVALFNEDAKIAVCADGRLPYAHVRLGESYASAAARAAMMVTLSNTSELYVYCTRFYVMSRADVPRPRNTIIYTAENDVSYQLNTGCRWSAAGGLWHSDDMEVAVTLQMEREDDVTLTDFSVTPPPTSLSAHGDSAHSDSD
jgi:hypothetical protein